MTTPITFHESTCTLYIITQHSQLHQVSTSFNKTNNENAFEQDETWEWLFQIAYIAKVVYIC
jgi:hypothetical protein